MWLSELRVRVICEYRGKRLVLRCQERLILTLAFNRRTLAIESVNLLSDRQGLNS